MSSKESVPERSNFLTVKEAAAVSSYTPAYLTRLAKKGDLDAKKHGRIWLIDARSLKKYARSIESRKAENRVRLRSERVTKLKNVEYSASWLFHKAQISPFDTRAALESLAIAGLSVLVAMLMGGFLATGAPISDLQAGAIAMLGEFNTQTAYLALNLADVTTQIESESLLAGVWSLFF